MNHTAHSVARKGVKKRDLSDVELREILCELLPLVRVDHVLPPNSEVLSQVREPAPCFLRKITLAQFTY